MRKTLVKNVHILKYDFNRENESVIFKLKLISYHKV